MTARERLVTLSVEKCPHCGKSHRFAALVRGAAPVMVFGGSGGDTERRVDVGVECPTTRLPLAVSLPLSTDEELVRLADPSQPHAPSLTGSPEVTDTGLSAEFEEWVKSSRATATDFAKTMLTSASAAVAVYFAVLKYLGVERRGTSFIGGLSVVPPILFLAAVIAFAVVQRPTLASITTQAQFDDFRRHRLTQLNHWITAGLALFVAGMAVAFVVFLRLAGLP